MVRRSKDQKLQAQVWIAMLICKVHTGLLYAVFYFLFTSHSPLPPSLCLPFPFPSPPLLYSLPLPFSVSSLHFSLLFSSPSSIPSLASSSSFSSSAFFSPQLFLLVILFLFLFFLFRTSSFLPHFPPSFSFLFLPPLLLPLLLLPLFYIFYFFSSLCHEPDYKLM